jgi:hypothetical protein
MEEVGEAIPAASSPSLSYPPPAHLPPILFPHLAPPLFAVPCRRRGKNRGTSPTGSSASPPPRSFDRARYNIKPIVPPRVPLRPSPPIYTHLPLIFQPFPSLHIGRPTCHLSSLGIRTSLSEAGSELRAWGGSSCRTRDLGFGTRNSELGTRDLGFEVVLGGEAGTLGLGGNALERRALDSAFCRRFGASDEWEAIGWGV